MKTCAFVKQYICLWNCCHHYFFAVSYGFICHIVMCQMVNYFANRIDCFNVQLFSACSHFLGQQFEQISCHVVAWWLCTDNLWFKLSEISCMAKGKSWIKSPNSLQLYLLWSASRVRHALAGTLNLQTCRCQLWLVKKSRATRFTRRVSNSDKKSCLQLSRPKHL